MGRIRVLVAEDSPTARALLVALLESDGTIAVVGEARSGAEAVERAVELRPDLVTMDIEMPEMNGLEATREIMVRAPVPIVIVSSSGSQREAGLSLDATEAGALCVVPKPGSPLAPEFEEERRQLLATVKAMAQVKVVRRWNRASQRGSPPLGTTMVPAGTGAARARIVAIAASTGGPAVLHQLLARLPATFPVPVIVVQHIASGFTCAFVRWLADGCRLRVKLAEHGEPLRAGTVYVAPEGRHCGVGEGIVILADGAPIGGFAPSATYLFESVARRYGAEAVAVILTGMGSDGVVGLRHVHAAGGRVLAQDEETSVVFGMPREAIRAGVVSAVLGPDAIADRLLLYIGGARDGRDGSRR